MYNNYLLEHEMANPRADKKLDDAVDESSPSKRALITLNPLLGSKVPMAAYKHIELDNRSIELQRKDDRHNKRYVIFTWETLPISSSFPPIEKTSSNENKTRQPAKSITRLRPGFPPNPSKEELEKAKLMFGEDFTVAEEGVPGAVHKQVQEREEKNNPTLKPKKSGKYFEIDRTETTFYSGASCFKHDETFIFTNRSSYNYLTYPPDDLGIHCNMFLPEKDNFLHEKYPLDYDLQRTWPIRYFKTFAWNFVKENYSKQIEKLDPEEAKNFINARCIVDSKSCHTAKAEEKWEEIRKIKDPIFQHDRLKKELMRNIYIASGTMNLKNQYLEEYEKKINQALYLAVKYKIDLELDWVPENFKEKNGTALMLAIRRGYANIAKSLLTPPFPLKKPNLSYQDPYGQTLLMAAAQGGDPGIFKMLLDQPQIESNIEQQDKKGNTPLSITARFGNLEILQLLIEKKAQQKGKALIEAVTQGHQHIVKALSEHLSPEEIEQKDSKGNTAIVIAARNGNTEIVKILMAKNAKEKESAFLEAVKSCNISTMKLTYDSKFMTRPEINDAVEKLLIDNMVKKNYPIIRKLHDTFKEEKIDSDLFSENSKTFEFILSQEIVNNFKNKDIKKLKELYETFPEQFKDLINTALKEKIINNIMDFYDLDEHKAFMTTLLSYFDSEDFSDENLVSELIVNLIEKNNLYLLDSLLEKGIKIKETPDIRKALKKSFYHTDYKYLSHFVAKTGIDISKELINQEIISNELKKQQDFSKIIELYENLPALFEYITIPTKPDFDLLNKLLLKSVKHQHPNLQKFLIQQGANLEDALMLTLEERKKLDHYDKKAELSMTKEIIAKSPEIKNYLELQEKLYSVSLSDYDFIRKLEEWIYTPPEKRDELFKESLISSIDSGRYYDLKKENLITMIDLCIEKKESSLLTIEFCNTLLSVCSKNNLLEVVDYILKKDVSFDFLTINNRYKTPIKIAIEKKDDELLEKFLHKIIITNNKIAFNNMLEQLIKTNHNIEFIEKMIKYPDWLTEENIEYLSEYSVSKSNYNVLDTLFKHGKIKDSLTLLKLAAKMSNLEMIDYLIKKSADPFTSALQTVVAALHTSSLFNSVSWETFAKLLLCMPMKQFQKSPFDANDEKILMSNRKSIAQAILKSKTLSSALADPTYFTESIVKKNTLLGYILNKQQSHWPSFHKVNDTTTTKTVNNLYKSLQKMHSQEQLSFSPDQKKIK
jgi:ankyrin repeat protein